MCSNSKTRRVSFISAEFFTYGYLGLFMASFLAATIVPFSSELILLSFLFMGYDPIICLLIATAGNWLGGMSSYFLGYLGKLDWLKRLKVSEQSIEKSKGYINRYGIALALFAWLPIVGDLFAVGLGFFRANVFWVALLMLIGKAVRYLVICWPFLS